METIKQRQARLKKERDLHNKKVSIEYRLISNKSGVPNPDHPGFEPELIYITKILKFTPKSNKSTTNEDL